jgi:hypothetical protein
MIWNDTIKSPNGYWLEWLSNHNRDKNEENIWFETTKWFHDSYKLTCRYSCKVSNWVSTHIIKIHHFKLEMWILKKLVIKWAQKQANIYHQAWLDLHPKCHLSTKTSSKQSLRQVISNYKRCLKTISKVLGRLLCNGRRRCDISQGLRHAIPWTHPQLYTKFNLLNRSTTSLTHPLVVF